MRYYVDIPSDVRRQIDNLPGHIRPRIRQVIAELADEPLPAVAKSMEDEWQGYYRIRIENYRILYTIYADRVVVEIVRVGKRGPNTYDKEHS